LTRRSERKDYGSERKRCNGSGKKWCVISPPRGGRVALSSVSRVLKRLRDPRGRTLFPEKEEELTAHCDQGLCLYTGPRVAPGVIKRACFKL